MLEILNISRRYGKNIVLDDLSLTVPEGKVACLVGPSGCGKSSLLRLVAGLDRPSAGEIRLGGAAISTPAKVLEPQRRGLNMVFQDYALWPHMNVERIVGYGLNRKTKKDRAHRVQELLETMQIAQLAKRLPSQISGGQQQRVAIARALATNPNLLLFDEPLSNLDVQLRLEMRKEFARLFRTLGKTVLYVTHDPLEASSFADILVVLKQGRIEQIGNPQDLFAKPRSKWIAGLAGYDNRVPAQIVGDDKNGLLSAMVGPQKVMLPASADIGSGFRGEVVLMLRPEAVLADSISPASEDALRLQGHVLQSLFEGGKWRVELDLGGGKMAAFILNERHAAGAEITIEIDPKAVLLFRP
ncbi:ABC transporter ATP-binding protein [Limoniibacter endophyticus]|uniref:Polyamine-transporting ATPase n=1 Tax=Limoniibacter endophyticus TaxID=1565040 RepID=A0A8J3DPS2_9HYPH|nr:ABC transporter ATP-binding protein [Limoniibacter endophyticus]GHC78036.1 polyamine-transporting ATPase [Limoniibacter endophyticus]